MRSSSCGPACGPSGWCAPSARCDVCCAPLRVERAAGDGRDERPPDRVAPHRAHEAAPRPEPAEPARGRRRAAALAEADATRDVGAALEILGRGEDDVEDEVADDDDRRAALGGPTGSARGREAPGRGEARHQGSLAMGVRAATTVPVEGCAGAVHVAMRALAYAHAHAAHVAMRALAPARVHAAHVAMRDSPCCAPSARRTTVTRRHVRLARAVAQDAWHGAPSARRPATVTRLPTTPPAIPPPLVAERRPRRHHPRDLRAPVARRRSASCQCA